MSLRYLQNAFINRFENSMDTTFLDEIMTIPNLSSSDQFTIYKHGIQSRFEKVLTITYPVCHKLVGDHFFHFMVDHYISEHAPYYFDLNAYGNHFSTFITSFAPASTLPYLSDVAKLEWAWHIALTAPMYSSFDFEKLSRHIDHGENIVFLLPTHSTLLSSSYPIHRIWELNQLDNISDTPFVLPEASTFFLFVWRYLDCSHISVLSQAEWKLLSLIQQGLTLKEINSTSDQSSNSLSLEKLLPELIHNGYIFDFNCRI